MKLYCLLVLLICGNVIAQNNTYNPNNEQLEFYHFAEYTNSGKNDLSIEQVIGNEKLVYLPVVNDNQSLGFTSDHYWARFRILNEEKETQTFYLETARPITDLAELFHIKGEKIEKFESGDQIPIYKRQVDHRSTVFKLVLPPQTDNQFYLHLSSDGETINLPLILYSESEFWMMNYKQQLFLGIFYGLLFLAGIIYLFFYSSLKEKTFLYYGLYVFSIALMQAALDGFIFQYIFPDGGYVNSRAVLITALCSNFFLLKYCEYFLKVKANLPKFKKIYNLFYAVIIVLFVLIFLSKKTLELTYPISNVNGLLSLIVILATIATMRMRKIQIDNYFSAGIFFLVIGLLGFVMNNLSLLPNNFYVLNSAKFGTGLEVIFLSLSMTNLIRNLRLEKEKSQEIALKKSEEISQMKTYFMSNISHEFRTPINAIMGIAQTQLELTENKETRKNFEIIKNASVSLLSNVNDILDFENIENNQLVLKEEEFNPSLLLNQINQNWKTEAKKKGLEYLYEIDYNIPAKVIGDPERFIQIVNNILSNAVKFTNEGEIKVKLNCNEIPDNKIQFSFVISDTGVGIPIEIKDSIFDSFNQMKQDNKRKFGGIGLGLTIVNHLVKLFGGSIEIENNKGSGTTFFVNIPLTATKKPLNMANNKAFKNDLKILVVEDNVMNQMIMRKLLSGSDKISFVVVENGKEAINALKKDVYDIVLMDLQMPIMDGYEATKIIRSGELGEVIGKVPIIAVTADAMQETKQRVMNIGMNDYMTKPVNKELLIEKIHFFSTTVN